MFDLNTKIVLVNLIYFMNPWKYPFSPQSTDESGVFKVDGQRTVQVGMMESEDDFPSGELPDLKATVVALPYKVLKP